MFRIIFKLFSNDKTSYNKSPMLILLTVFFCQNSYAQQWNSFDSLTVKALCQFIDSLYFYNYLSPNCIDSNYYLFLSDYRGKENIFKDVDRTVYFITKERNNKLWLGYYCNNENCNGRGWHFSKSVRPKESKYIMVILKPNFDFKSDTLVISFRTACYYWGKSRNNSKSYYCWQTGISDWGIFEFIFSNKQRKWIQIFANVGGI